MCDSQLSGVTLFQSPSHFTAAAVMFCKVLSYMEGALVGGRVIGVSLIEPCARLLLDIPQEGGSEKGEREEGEEWRKDESRRQESG